jgi:uncharacterized phage protein (TIGR02218 family)
MSEAWMKGPVTSASYGWRLERRDGVTLGFTSHDRDVEIGGILYRASPGMLPTSITESIGLQTGGLEVTGAIDSAAIREDDLKAGRWDDARLTIFLFDWSDPTAPIRQLANGEWGEVSYSDAGFETELRGANAFLDAPAVPQTSPGCRAEFCGKDCGLNAQRYAQMIIVSGVSGDQVTFDAAQVTAADNAFSYGQLRWLNGPNSGLSSEIFSSSSGVLTLANSPAFPVIVGTLSQIFQGCDKTIATCSGRFNNAINFRGEPFLPGNDLLTRYPGVS